MMMPLWLDLFLTFFKIGALTFGGGYAMIPMIQSETISKGWITEEMLVDFLAVSESTPGPFAVNISTFIGNSQLGVLGAFLATLGVILPSFIIILIVYQFYSRFIKNRYVNGALTGLRATALGLIFSVGFLLVFREIMGSEFILMIRDFTKFQGEYSFNYVSLIFFGILIAIQIIYKLITKKSINTILFILIAAAIGMLTYGLIL